ncbi:vWA domain-containing protein [Beggiatoa leptomitoformis]|uniref:VWA domain-containing protein n=1 Tax=Beggiatoa leptomitoformis TaxID=288004 RepID=A0A2N9YHP6_9GAMM|nr:VWA domain-containing protein [Beggiatoa leptomitoformis]ALG67730.1 VWA domain-containing protein [Beggiatoa leptomitoformis]AUI70030.1 VWA domain-containing protein [Beggiatoa leptomitoformis]
MLEFEWIWLFLVLPLPLIIRYGLKPAAPVRTAAIRVPFLEDFSSLTRNAPITTKYQRWQLVVAALAWLCLVIAAARPQWLDEPIALPVSGRDLMLAVDLSGSMEIGDFQLQNRMVDRLTATKAVAGDFIERRVGDRVGLILFGEQAYLQTPLTFDRTTVRALLLESAIGLAGQKTAIGDAIGLAVKRLRDQPVQSRIVILLTDGANTAGAVEPLKAAELAAQAGLKIYTIGIGADEVLVQDLFGTRRVNPSVDLDEKTLTAIAEKTNGRYFRARDTQALEEIYAELDKLEPIEKENQYFRPSTALFYYPLALALLLAMFLWIVRIKYR